MADKNYDILISIEARVQAIQEATNQVQRLVQTASGFQNAFGFAGIIELTHRLGEVISEIPRALAEGVRAGIEFNAEVQNLQTNLAGVLRLTQSDQFGSFEQAKAAAGEYIEVIKVAANKVGISYHDMFETVNETQAQLASAGVTGINEAIRVSLLLSQAMQAVGVGAQNASRDVGDLLQGNLITQGGRRLAAAIGLTTEEFQKQIQAALQSGTLIELLTSRLAPLEDAIHDAAQNFGADINRMKNLLTDLESEAAKPIMDPLKNGIDGAIDPTKTEQLRILARTIGEIGAVALQAAVGVVKLGAAIDNVGKHYSGLVSALRVISQITPTGLAFHDLVAGSYEKSTKAVQGEIAATKEAATAHTATGTAAQAAISRTVQLTEKQRAELEKTNAAAKLLEDTLAGNAKEVALDRATEAVRQMRVEWEKQGPLTKEQEAALNRLHKATYDTVLAQQEHKQAAAGSRDATIAERDARRAITDLLHEDSALLHGLQTQQRLIAENPFLGADERQAALHANAIQQQAELAAAIDKTKEALQQAYGGGSQQDILSLGQRLTELQARFVELGYTASTTTFVGQFGAELVQWVNSFGTAAHAAAQIVTGTLNTAIGAASQALTGLIFQTRNWKDAFATAAQSIIANIIQIVLQYTIGRAIMFLINKAFGSQESQSNNQRASQAAAQWAPAAIAASTASYGLAAAAGLAAFLGAEAIGTAFAVGLSSAGGSYAVGGYTGHGASSDVAGIVHAGEYVLNADATRVLGVNNLDELHARASAGLSLDNLSFSARSPGYQAGGFVGGDGADGGNARFGLGGGDTHVFVLFDERELRKRVLESTAARKKIIDMVNGAGGSLRS